MQHPDDMNPGGMIPADRELEAALAGLAPAALRQSRDEWLFRAGAESVRIQFRRRLRTWQSLAAVLALSTALSLVTRRPPVGHSNPKDLAVRLVPPPPRVPSDVSVPPPADPNSALSLRDAVLARGMDGLPPMSRDDAPSSAPIPSPRSATWQ